MQSRVAIARVLSYDPKFLLMDEPFGDLDEITKEQLNIELLKLWQETGMTIIFVTHNISEAVLLSDRVAIMSKNPSKIKKIYNIDLSRPRNIETKKNKRYYDLLDHIKDDLKQEFLV
jgi:NitT/TauT family transport system ATP-binding protein